MLGAPLFTPPPHEPPPPGSSTITVSGYEPVVAYVASGVARASGPGDLEAFFSRTARVAAGRSASAVARCHGCNVWKPRAELADARLGFDSYCDGCVALEAERCQARHGRLPAPGEFFCIGCGWISARAVQAKPDADGRRRSRCVLCRQEQVRAAELRRRQREFIVAEIAP